MTNVTIIIVSFLISTFIVVPAYLLLKKLFGWKLSRAINEREKQQAGLLIQCIAYLCYLEILFGIWVFYKQLVKFLETGFWKDMTVSAVLTRSLPDTAFVTWLDYPHFWIGLNRVVKGILGYIPVSLLFIGVGIWMLIVIDNFYDEDKG